MLEHSFVMINEHLFDFSGGEVSRVLTTGLDPDDETKKLCSWPGALLHLKNTIMTDDS